MPARRVLFGTALLLISLVVAPACRHQASDMTQAGPSPAPDPHYYRRVAALCIGVDRYLSPGIPALSSAVADATAVSERLRTLYGYDAATLCGPRATKRAIEDAIDRHVEGLGPDDCLIVYFAGHGKIVELPSVGQAGFLVPYDAELDLHDASDPARWTEEAIDARGLVERAAPAKAKHVLFIADACFSGFMTSRGNFQGRFDLQSLLIRPSRAVLAATSRQQTAVEGGPGKHGFYTAALLDELSRLSREADAASVTDLFVVLRQVVGKSSSKTMTPQMSNVGDGEFVFLPRSIDADLIRSAIGNEAGATPNALSRVVDRVARRNVRSVSMGDLIEASQAYDYHFSSEPARGELEWQAKRLRFEEAASRTNPLAQAAMFFCASRGFGQAADPAEAHRFALDAFQTGDAAGKHVLARSYLDGTGVARNRVAGERLMAAAAEASFPLSMYENLRPTLEKIEAGRSGSEASFEEGELARLRSGLELASGAGVAEATRTLAMLISNGQGGFKRDPGRAVRLLRDATKGGPNVASQALGQILWGGVQGTLPPDPDAAVAEIRRAAAAGDPWAQYRLAYVLSAEGGGAPSEANEAFRWAELAHRQGQASVEVILAAMYFDGRGVGKDVDQGIKCLERGRDGGSKAAILQLATVHREGIHVPPDLDLALKYSVQAGQLGMPDGWYQAGLCYEQKYDEWVRGVERDALFKERSGEFDPVTIRDRIAAEMPHNPLARQAVLHYLKASRMGHEKAKVSLHPRNQLGRPELIKWAEAALEPDARAVDLDFRDVPDWILEADRAMKQRADDRSRMIRQRLIDEQKAKRR